jgi:hypothetical protein
MLRLQSLLYAIVPVPGTVRSLRDVSGEPCGNHGLLRNCKFTVIATHTRGYGSAGGSAFKSGLKTSQNTCRYNLRSNPSH